MPDRTPYGHWPSPLTADHVAAGGRRLQQPCVAGDRVFWTESRPEEGGRSTVVSADRAGDLHDWVPPPYAVRAKLHGYGGGAYAVDDDLVYFVNADDQAICCTDGERVQTIGGRPGHAYGDLLIDAANHRLICVRERRGDGDGAIEALIAVSLDDGAETVLASGHDFYATPALSPDGRRLAFLSWDHPDMPWDATTLWLASLDTHGMPGTPEVVAGGERESVVGPTWDTAGRLLFASDRTDGYWHIHRLEADGTVLQLTFGDWEVCHPPWVPGMCSFAPVGGGALLVASTRDGVWELQSMEPDGALQDLLFDRVTQVDHLHASPAGAVLVGGGPQMAPTIIRRDHDGEVWEHRRSLSLDLPDRMISAPRPVDFETGDGEVAHGFLYQPTNPDVVSPGGPPPLILKVHGGPTAATGTALDPKVQYWTTRGFALFDLNYRGSTGYGRAYRERLYGGWGEVDVEDAANAVRHLAERGWCDPEHCFISGSSAGGYTVLRALMYTEAFQAGACYYGVSDLEAICDDTVRFEARYGDKLIAPYPAEIDRFRELSPIHHAEQLRRPVVFFQGGADEIVPPDQTHRMVEALRAAGVPCEEHLFPDEGHGFRAADTIRTCLEAELAFYRSLL